MRVPDSDGLTDMTAHAEREISGRGRRWNTEAYTISPGYFDALKRPSDSITCSRVPVRLANTPSS
jgi:hypothetical protein